MDIIEDIALQFALALLCAGSVAGMLMGLGLLLRSEWTVRFNQYLSQWLNADRVAEKLDRPRPTTRFLYRHHRWVGLGLTAGASFVLYTFLFSYNVRRISAVTPPEYWVVVDALTAVLLIGSVLAATVGMLVALKPSLLRDLEKSANHWVSTEGIARFFNSMRPSPDEGILRRRKLAGVLILAGSFFALGTLGPLLARGGLNF